MLALLVLMLASVSASATAACDEPQADKLLWTYDFTTQVLGAHNPKAKGVNGFYRMWVYQRPGCRIEATIAKLGYNKVRFAANKIQYGTFPVTAYDVQSVPLEPGSDDDTITALLIDATLKSEKGRALHVGFTFVRGHGFWRYVGPSWEESGMWGVLQGAEVKADRGDQYRGPSKVACNAVTLKNRAQQTEGVLFSCVDLLFATAALDRATYFYPSESTGMYFVERIGRISPRSTHVSVELCTNNGHDNGVDHRQVRYARMNDGVVQFESRRATTKALARCGYDKPWGTPPTIRPRPKQKPRWGGAVE